MHETSLAGPIAATMSAWQRRHCASVTARFRGPIVLNQAYGLADANAELASGRADAIAFGKAFIANPDLPARLARGAALAVPDSQTFYTQGEAGYTDYPAL